MPSLALGKPLATLALLGTCLASQAVPTLELKETPPLKPLHYCKDSDGRVRDQIDDCGPGTTEVSSVFTPGANGKPEFQKLGTTLESAPAAAAAPATPSARETASAIPASANAQAGADDVMRQGRKSLFKFLAFVLVFGIAAKLTGRSFLRWAIVGAVVNFVLVGANLISS